MRFFSTPSMAMLVVLLARAAHAQECATALHGAVALDGFVTQINSLCCNGGSGHRRQLQAEDCVLGTCTLACAELLVPYFEECPERMHELVGHASGIHHFRATCAETLFDRASTPGCASAATNSWGKPATTDAQRNAATIASFSPRVRNLLAGMTPEQKIGQMTQVGRKAHSSKPSRGRT